MADKPRKLFQWKDRYWRTVRSAVQASALALFLFLFVRTVRGGIPPLAGNLFLHLDPLAMLAGLLASKTYIAGMALALLTLLLTILFGRAWCGWLCPLGTILDLFHPRRWKNKQPSIPEGTRGIKHFLLTVILTSALLGSLWLIFLDPLTIMIRTLTEALYPALDRIILAVEEALYGVSALRGAVSALDRTLRPALLPADPAFTAGGVLIAAFFAGIIAANALAPRFWCRYLCPLGSLLGLTSKIAIFRREVNAGACNECGACARICPTGTINPEKTHASDPAECTMCLDCVAACPRAGQSFPAHSSPAALEYVRSGEKAGAHRNRRGHRRQWRFCAPINTCGGISRTCSARRGRRKTICSPNASAAGNACASVRPACSTRRWPRPAWKDFGLRC